jgi:hypothetical protein
MNGDATGINGDATGAHVPAMVAVNSAFGHNGTAGRFLMVQNNAVETCYNLKTAILAAARSATALTLLKTAPKADAVHVRLRYMVLASGSTVYGEPGHDMVEPHGPGRSPDTLDLDYEQLPHAYARMVVQVPSQCEACMQGSVSVMFKGETRSYRLDQGFQYVLAYSQSAVHIHAPTQGSCAYLVYDVRCFEPIPEPVLGDNHAALVKLQQCVRCWERDKSCEKLAVVLQGTPETTRALGKEGFQWSKYHFGNESEQAIMDVIMSCSELEVGLAGKMCVYSGVSCVYACICVCMHAYVCVCVCVCVYE